MIVLLVSQALPGPVARPLPEEGMQARLAVLIDGGKK
jgi:hypothetical protein